MNIVFLDESTLGTSDLSPINSLGSYNGYPTSTPEEALARVADADVIIINKVKVTAALMDAAPKLKLICEAATGVNNIDLEAAAERGIPVKNVAGYSTDAVVQTTFMHILNLLGRGAYFDNVVKSGKYSSLPIFCDPKPYVDIAGKTIGIIGMGNIGSRVARVAEAFGMNVVYYSTSGTGHCTDYQCLSIEQLLKVSDVVSIHAPLNERTKNLIGAAELKMMKPSSILVNLGRGCIVDESALADAINAGTIAGAGFDVFEHEPLQSTSPLLSVKYPGRLSLSPHIAWASEDSMVRLINGIAQNIKDTFSL